MPERENWWHEVAYDVGYDYLDKNDVIGLLCDPLEDSDDPRWSLTQWSEIFSEALKRVLRELGISALVQYIVECNLEDGEYISNLIVIDEKTAKVLSLQDLHGRVPVKSDEVAQVFFAINFGKPFTLEQINDMLKRFAIHCAEVYANTSNSLRWYRPFETTT